MILDLNNLKLTYFPLNNNHDHYYIKYNYVLKMYYNYNIFYIGYHIYDTLNHLKINNILPLKLNHYNNHEYHILNNIHQYILYNFELLYYYLHL